MQIDDLIEARFCCSLYAVYIHL